VPSEETEPEALEQTQVEAEALEQVSSDAVTIAAIEADKEIALAEIAADTRLAEAEIYSEAAEQTAQENDVWPILNQLSSQVAALSEQMATLLTVEIVEQPLSSLEADLVEAAMLTAPENNLTQNDTSPETNSMATEHIEKSAEESPIPPLVEVDGKPIIRLI
jgi:hypothetical protein